MKRRQEPVKFLIVDDREENILSLEALLRRDGLEVLAARSGNDALELLLVHEFALALLDVQMPEMDGFALAELMRGTRHVPIIFVTASPEEQHRVFQGYDAGAVDFLFKPVDPRVLRHKANVFFSLYRQRQELAETLRLNETFVAAIGHDLKNPLNSIAMGAELLLGASDERTRKVAERLRSSSRRMSGMIDDLFDLARARLSGGIPIERAFVDLNDVVIKVLGEFESTYPARVAPFQPQKDSAGLWDGSRLGQVVANLVGNALRHGAPDVPVTVTIENDEETVRLTVKNGGTIAADVRDRLFDPFRSTQESRTARAEGLGLGLYIVHQLVVAHGGDVEVTSTEAEGTCFSVTLPRGAPASSPGA
jgi:two-component system sensor histidine kinase/response regulator